MKKSVKAIRVFCKATLPLVPMPFDQCLENVNLFSWFADNVYRALPTLKLNANTVL